MAEFRLTYKAVQDLSEIWEYTCQFWSENQADKYYNTLISTCQQIASNPQVGKEYKDITQDLFGVKTNRHIIFYRMMEEGYVENLTGGFEK
jgi:toxin ParE1/3/4